MSELTLPMHVGNAPAFDDDAPRWGDFADTQQTPATTLSITFTGSGSEYFRIWIVNLLLTLVTLGPYYPWAKVRHLRYFHGNTLVGGVAAVYVAMVWVWSVLAVVVFLLLAFIFLFTMLTFVGFIQPYITTRMQNLVWNHTHSSGRGPRPLMLG